MTQIALLDLGEHFGVTLSYSHVINVDSIERFDQGDDQWVVRVCIPNRTFTFDVMPSRLAAEALRLQTAAKIGAIKNHGDGGFPPVYFPSRN